MVTTASQTNSFDLLPLCAADLVLYSRQYPLLGLAEPELLGWTAFDSLGVSIFFLLNGFLVWSWFGEDCRVSLPTTLSPWLSTGRFGPSPLNFCVVSRWPWLAASAWSGAMG